MRDLGKADRIFARTLKQLIWRDPRADLIALSEVDAEFTRRGSPITHDDLRRRGLREFLERKQAALFAYLLSKSVHTGPIQYALIEAEDYDCLLRFAFEGKLVYSRVQLKEVVPQHLNPTASIDEELAKLRKYATSSQTIVAVHINQEGPVVFSSVAAPETSVAEIWLYSSLAPDQSRWFLYGNLLYRPSHYEVDWPTI